MPKTQQENRRAFYAAHAWASSGRAPRWRANAASVAAPSGRCPMIDWEDGAGDSSRRRLNVLQVAGTVGTSDGGPPALIISVNRELRAAGVNAIVVSTDANGPGRLTAAHRRQLGEAEDIRVSLHRVTSPRRLRPSVGLAAAVVRLSAGADVIHIHGLYQFHSAVAAIIARLRRVPYIVQPHGVLEPYQRRESRTVKAVYDFLIGRQILAGAAEVLFSDESEMQRALDMLRPGLGVVVPPGASLQLDQAEPPTGWRPEWANDKVILYVGRLAPKKRIDILIAAMPHITQSHASARLIIAGACAGDSYEDLRSLAARSPVADRIHFVGEVVDGNKAFLFSRAHLFALTSDNENFGVSIAEAFIAGVPVVTTQGVALGKVVCSQGAGIVIPKPDAEAAAAAISMALQPINRAAFSARSRELGTRYTWRTTATEYIRIYQLVSSMPQRRSAARSSGVPGSSSGAE